MISVIIPIYNQESYLKRCVDSVLNQRYSYFELILVDDGSTDRSPAICDRFAETDNRIKVIHKSNGGLSDARNCGLEAATGEYIAFIDSDDFVSPFYLETLLNLCETNNCEIAQCAFIRISGSEIFPEKQKDEYKIYESGEYMDRLFGEKYVETVVAWNKLYKRSLFDDVRFPEGRIYEDEATTYLLIDKCKKIAVTDAGLYMYFMSENSITRSEYSLKRLDILEAYRERSEFFELNVAKELKIKNDKKYIVSVIDNYCKVKKYIDDSDKILLDLKKQYAEVYKRIIKSDTQIHFKIIIFIFKYIPSLYPIWKKLRKR